MFSSKHEMFPVSIIEAMASGIPYISTDVGCIRALPGGFVINSEDEMTKLIDYLIDNLEIRDTIGAIGKEYANKYLRIEKKVNILNNLLKEICYGEKYEK